MNVSWLEACELMGVYEDDALAAGWPASLPADSLAFLQSGYSVGNSWDEALTAAGAAICITTVGEAKEKLRRPRSAVRQPGQKKKKRYELFQFAIESAVKKGEIEVTAVSGVPYISAQAFANWLCMQGKKPSKHVRNWFESQHVEEASSETPVSKLEAANVSDWASLIRYRAQFSHIEPQKRPPWTDAHVAIVRQKLKEEESAGRGRGAKKRLGEELGFKQGRQGVDGVLNRHPEKTANAFSGLGGR